MINKYIYPKFPAAKINPFFRIGGNGLANCLFVYAKAIVLASQLNCDIIKPVWFNLSLGTYLRGQSDKRHYLGIFKSNNEIKGLKRLIKLWFSNKTKDVDAFKHNDSVLIVEGIYDFFKPLLGYSKLINEYILSHVKSSLLQSINAFDFTGCIAIHVRLGDFPESRRIPMAWYINKIKEKPANKFLLFSDGNDEELMPLLNLTGVERVYFGGAIQDIIAMSKCSYIIGSDSSFSAWAAFLGQVPCVYYKLQFGQVLENRANQIIEHS